jgi:hypothetical protein
MMSASHLVRLVFSIYLVAVPKCVNSLGRRILMVILPAIVSISDAGSALG